MGQESAAETMYRIWFGQAPAGFILEVVARAVVTYACLLLALKLLGKRMVGQVTITETAVMITLGAIVSLAMQQATRGILQGLAALALAVAFQWLLGVMEFKSGLAERIIAGRMQALVKDGVLQLPAMRRAGITRGQLFSILREADFRQLGIVRRCYLESCGSFSIYAGGRASGLSLLPPERPVPPGVSADPGGAQVCSGCGLARTADHPERECPVCRSREWTVAVR